MDWTAGKRSFDAHVTDSLKNSFQPLPARPNPNKKNGRQHEGSGLIPTSVHLTVKTLLPFIFIHGSKRRGPGFLERAGVGGLRYYGRLRLGEPAAIPRPTSEPHDGKAGIRQPLLDALELEAGVEGGGGKVPPDVTDRNDQAGSGGSGRRLRPPERTPFGRARAPVTYGVSAHSLTIRRAIPRSFSASPWPRPKASAKTASTSK